MLFPNGLFCLFIFFRRFVFLQRKERAKKQKKNRQMVWVAGKIQCSGGESNREPERENFTGGFLGGGREYWYWRLRR